MSKLVEGATHLAKQIHGGHVDRKQEVRERKSHEWERKCRMAEFQHRISHDRAVAANLARTERNAYMDHIRHQATAIRNEGQALRQRARDLRATQTIPFVNDVRHRVHTALNKLSNDMSVIRQLLSDPEYTALVAEAVEAGESIPAPAPEFVRRPQVPEAPGGAGGALGGVLGGVTGALGGVTDTVGGVVKGATNAVGGVTNAVGGVVEGATGTLGGVTGALGGATGALGGVTDAVGGVVGGMIGALEEAASVLEEAADALEKAADALGGGTDIAEGALEGATDTLGEATDTVEEALEGATRYPGGSRIGLHSRATGGSDRDGAATR